MKRKYNTAALKRMVLTRLAEHILNDKTDRDFNMLPINMGDELNQVYRCCRYKDRAILKYRLMAGLGFPVENEVDELYSPAEYLKDAEKRSKAPEGTMTVISEACSSCHGSEYYISEICRGCVARPCETNCPKEAVTVKNGRSVIDQTKCIKCGKCAQACPYGAVLKLPVPCEEACPVDAVSKDENNHEIIDYDKCISCGKCMTACPFGAITDISHLADVLFHLKRGTPLAALYAPSIAGQLPGTLRQINQGLKTAGFTRVFEVASGAEQTAVMEGRELTGRLKEDAKAMTTSCCPVWVETVKRHLPELQGWLSETPSPMAITAVRVKEQDKNRKTVFIGPCTGKKTEASGSDDIDYVLSFEELGTLFIAAGIDILEMDEIEADTLSALQPPRRGGANFPHEPGHFKSGASDPERPIRHSHPLRQRSGSKADTPHQDMGEGQNTGEFY